MSRGGDIRQLDDDELRAKLVDVRKELFNLRFQLATGQLENTARLGQVRREVARVTTVYNERAASVGAIHDEGSGGK
ncbi:MAG: 50S ribosomal protein L29 [Acidimicrobiales bacterium]